MSELIQMRRQIELSDAAEALDKAIKQLPEKVTLSWVSYDESLPDDAIKEIFDGKDYYEAYWFNELECDNRHYYISETIADLDITSEEQNLIEQNGLREDLEMEIAERDEADLFGDLLRNTGHKWMRYDLDIEIPGYVTDEYLEELLEEALPLGNLNVTSDTVKGLGSGGGLYLLWYGDVTPFVNACLTEQPMDVTWTNPSLVLFERVMGSGWDVDTEGTITLRFDPNNIWLDEGKWSYSGDVCGGLYAARNTFPVTTKEVS